MRRCPRFPSSLLAVAALLMWVAMPASAWETTIGPRVSSLRALAVDGENDVIAAGIRAGDFAVVKLSAATGAVLWWHPWRTGQPHVALPAILSEDRVLISSG